jgi:hypothetical protein
MSFFNLVQFTAVSGGTGNFVAATVPLGFRSPTIIPAGTPVSYTARAVNFSQFETGHGTWHLLTGLSRDAPFEGSGGLPVNFASPPNVWIDFLAQDIGATSQNTSIQTPADGFSITIANTIAHLVLDPAGQLNTGTVTLPAIPTLSEVDIRSTQPVSQFTLAPNAGQTVKWDPGTLAANQLIHALYDPGSSTWYVG